MEFIPKDIYDKVLEYYLSRVTIRSKLIYWFIIILLICVVISLPLIYVDVTVQARGFFQSEIERQAIFAPYNGKVLFASLKTGAKISRGDTLLIIGNETIKAELTAINQKISENNSSIADLQRLLTISLKNEKISEVRLETKRYSADYKYLLKLLELNAQKYYRTKAEYLRKKILHEQKMISDSEFESSYFDFRSEEENLRQIVIQSKGNWETDLTQRRSDSIYYEADQQRCLEEIKNRVVLAPVSGEIVQSTELQTGSFIYSNQQVAEISPLGTILATCYVSPADIGLIKLGQKVLLQVDALKYTEWGLLEATIIDVSDDMIIDNNQAVYFRVKCKPLGNYLSLRNGVRADIIKGMSFNARIVVTRRSLLNLLFDKTDDWFNPYMDTKKSGR